MSDYDKSTGEGQKRLFYDVQKQVGETVHEKMARLSYDAGYKDSQAGAVARIPGNDDYMGGYRDGSPA